jgi:hypothetical protein
MYSMLAELWMISSKICSVMRGVMPLSSSSSMSAPCRGGHQAQRLPDDRFRKGPSRGRTIIVKVLPAGG